MINEKKPDFEFLDGLIKELREQTEGLIGLPEEEKSEDIFLEKNPESLKSMHKSYRKNLNKKGLFEKDNLNVPLSAFSNSSNSLLPNFPAEPFSKLFNISGLIDKDLNNNRTDNNFKNKNLMDKEINDKYFNAQDNLPMLPDLPSLSSGNPDKNPDKTSGKSVDKTSEDVFEKTSDVKEKKIKEFFDISKKINLYRRNKNESNFYHNIKNDVSSGFDKKKVSEFKNEDENLDETLDKEKCENKDEEEKSKYENEKKYAKKSWKENWEESRKENEEDGKKDDGRFHKKYSAKTKVKPMYKQIKNNNEFLSYSKFQDISQVIYGINSHMKSSKLHSLNKNSITESEKISSEKMLHEIEIIQENLLKINSSLFKTLS